MSYWEKHLWLGGLWLDDHLMSGGKTGAATRVRRGSEALSLSGGRQSFILFLSSEYIHIGVTI